MILRESFSPGETVYLGLESWAGRTWHKVRILRLRGTRADVLWVDAPVGRRRRDDVFHPPVSALRRDLP